MTLKTTSMLLSALARRIPGEPAGLDRPMHPFVELWTALDHRAVPLAPRRQADCIRVGRARRIDTLAREADGIRRPSTVRAQMDRDGSRKLRLG